jgi:4'-phosphopantetheinyl transferase
MPSGICSDGRRFLSEGELKRAASFHFPDDSRSYIFRRIFVRVILARYLLVHPSDICFLCTRYGKPYLPLSPDGRQYEFSMSHSCQVTVLAVAEGARVGVDVEETGRDFLDIGVFKAACSIDELDYLRQLPEDERCRSFLRLWTAKESYLKAIGLGLLRDPRELHFTRQSVEKADGALELANQPTWKFYSFVPLDGYQCSLAVETPGDVPIIIRSLAWPLC